MKAVRSLLATLACFLMGCDGRPHATGEGLAARAKSPIAIFDLSDGVPEKASAGFLGFSVSHTSFDEFVHSVERLAGDDRVRGVLVRLGGTRLGLARATEIGALLHRVDERIPVWCHADDLGNATLYVVATGCRRTWMSPSGSVDAVGLAAQLIYFHKLLADRLGLDVNFLQVGKYKGAEEPFTRDGPSPEARASLDDMLGALRSAWVAGISRGRPRATEASIEDGPYAAGRARELGLVDELGYFDEARESLQREVAAGHADVWFGPGESRDDVADMLRDVAGGWFGDAPVALVRAVGAITLEGQSFGEGGIVERRLAHTLARLEKDDHIKAVVLRVDSPGGSALASDLLWHALMRVRSRKPLVVSVGDMAASGGYFIASAGSVILADEASILGSIGVVGGKISAGRALGELGVHSETLSPRTGDGHASSRAALESPLVAWDEATRERVLATMVDIYDLFLSRVAEGRSVSIERVAQSAEGRLFGGREAKERGLVDELGGLADAIARARSLAGLPSDAAVDTAEISNGWLQSIADTEVESRGATSRLAASLAPDGSELVAFVDAIMPFSAAERTVCALPFALTLR
ncbi:MAG: S49 family peptidase [Polyangiaceae bacterium]|jgi:protease-4